MSMQRQAPRTPDRPGRSFFDFSPKHINDYQQCPEFFYWRHIKRQWARKPFSRSLEIGKATHNALASVWKERLKGFELPDNFVWLATQHLNESIYTFEEKPHWPEDIATVAGHIERCLLALDDDLSVISVERELSHELARARAGPPVRIQSRVDLVVRRADGAVEHVDYKTGKKWPDVNQEVMSRVVVRTMLSAGDDRSAALVSTTLYSADGTKVSAQLSRDECRPVWDAIVTTVGAIRDAEQWSPKPGRHCDWCDFRERCSVRGET
jgi:putative RecB family exonuclease